MDINEVPQEPLQFKGRDSLNKLMYAVDQNGNYTGVKSAGWMPEHIAMKQAWESVDAEIRETCEKIQAGELSPLAYFMQKNLMDLALLARYMGKWKWQVRRHLKPGPFKRLKKATLEHYASVLNTTVEELTSFDGQPQPAPNSTTS